MGVEEFKSQMLNRGWYSFPEFIGMDLVERMRSDLEDSYARCRQIQIENGLDKTEGTCHHILDNESSFIDCLKYYERLDEYFTEYFGGKYILNSFGGNILSKGMSYANDIHRDIRSYSGSLPLMLNTIIFLDDFTEENGATWLMDGGHRWDIFPSDADWNRNKFQITGKAGTMFIWNSNLWHKAGENKTDYPRRSVTPEFTKCFMKQGYNYTKFVNNDSLEYIKQLLGWYSRTPSTLQEWYRPKDKRFYRDNQG